MSGQHMLRRGRMYNVPPPPPDDAPNPDYPAENDVWDNRRCCCTLAWVTLFIGTIAAAVYTEQYYLTAFRKEVELDYALQSLGGYIASTRGTETYGTHSFLGIPWPSGCTNQPCTILQPSVVPGVCWGVKGSKGCVAIGLQFSIAVTHVSIDHITKSQSPTGETSSAPKQFSVKGLVELDDQKPFHLGTFTYNNDGPSWQTFPVNESTKRFRIIEFIFHSNHGNPHYTCLYRIRVHGNYHTA